MGDIFIPVFYILLAFLGIAALIYYLHYRKNESVSGKKEKYIQIIEQKQLDMKCRIVVMRCVDQLCVIAIGDGRVVMLHKLQEKSVAVGGDTDFSTNNPQLYPTDKMLYNVSHNPLQTQINNWSQNHNNPSPPSPNLSVHNQAYDSPLPQGHSQYGATFNPQPSHPHVGERNFTLRNENDFGDKNLFLREERGKEGFFNNDKQRQNVPPVGNNDPSNRIVPDFFGNRNGEGYK